MTKETTVYLNLGLGTQSTTDKLAIQTKRLTKKLLLKYKFTYLSDKRFRDLTFLSLKHSVFGKSNSHAQYF